MSLIIINGIDVSSRLTKYEIIDDEPVKLSEIIMADGTSLIRLAPYSKTELHLTFSNLKGDEYLNIQSQFSSGEATVKYYSEKTNETKEGVFFLEPGMYSIRKKTEKKNVLYDYSMVLKKTR